MIWILDTGWAKPPMSMNDRPTPQQKARETAAVRRHVYLLARAAKIPPQKRVAVRMIWTVPDRIRRDVENPTTTYKAVCDALAAPVLKRGLVIAPGALIVPDDTPEFMAKSYCDIRYEKGVSAVTIEVEGIE